MPRADRVNFLIRDEDLETAQALAFAEEPDADQSVNPFQIPFSATGQLPASHWGASAPASAEFVADRLPLLQAALPESSAGADSAGVTLEALAAAAGVQKVAPV